MTEQDRDPMIDRVRETLRSAPAATPDPLAVGRLLQAVYASPRPAWFARAWEAWRLPALSGLGASAVAAVALVVGFVSRGAVTPRVEMDPPAASGPATGEYPVVLASNDGEARIATQFVFEAAEAREVALVGDFNGWNATELPMVRVANGVWEATVPLPPGRHVYAFMVDGKFLKADPRAPKAGDADYGREGSVVMVFAR